MMEPGKARVRVRAERQETPGDRDESLGIRDAGGAERVVTHVVERQPVARPTALVHQLGASREVRLDRRDVADEECGVDARLGDAWICSTERGGREGGQNP